MIARLRSWWEKVRKPLEIFVVLVGCILVIALLVVIVLAYIFNVNITGLRGKTLWDWLQLLIIPALLGFGAVWFTTRQNHDREIALDNQCEAALQGYLDKMSELLLEKKLRQSQPDDEVRSIAQVQTLTVLSKLDPIRKRTVLKFLFESKLINKDKSIVNLSYVDLNKAALHRATLDGANLSEARLRNTDLSGAELHGANLSEARLQGADLSGTDLSKACLRNADLSDANLSEARLQGADLSGADLQGAKLQGAKYNSKPLHVKRREETLTLKPTQWPQEFDPQSKGAICVD